MSVPLLLAVNCGSTSIKFALFAAKHGLDGAGTAQRDFDVFSNESLSPVVSGQASSVHAGKGTKPSFKFSTHDSATGDKVPASDDIAVDGSSTHEAVFTEVLKRITSDDVIGQGGKGRIALVGHRIVHGGTEAGPVMIKHGDKGEKATLERMELISTFAPLHNHHAMLIVKHCLHELPQARSVLAFDTLFHQSIPAFRHSYAIAKPEHKTPIPLRRYGFHGLSYSSITQQLARHLGKDPTDVNAVIAHMGGGGSVCLVIDGKSQKTSMGLTPLEGLPGGSRSGSVDPSLLFHHTPDCSDMADWNGQKLAKGEFVLNKESGFKALAGTSDFGEIVGKGMASPPSEQHKLALDLYLDQVCAYVADYTSILLSQGRQLDGIVLSGGIGEKSPPVRQRIVGSLAWVEHVASSGGGVDPEKNDKDDNDLGAVTEITRHGSKIPGYVIKTDEERETLRLSVLASRT